MALFGEDLPTVGAKVVGEIGDLLGKIEILKKAIKDLKREASGKTDLRIATDMNKELKKLQDSMSSGIIRNALKKQLERDLVKEAELAGQSSAKRFASAWRDQMKKEKFRVPGWLPWVGLGAAAAPAAITGAAGAIGGLGTALFGAAAGIAALGASASEILAPVKQAFTTLDQMNTQNRVRANATALQTWLTGSTTTVRTRLGSRTFNAAVIQKEIAAAQARVAADQLRLAFAKTPVQAASAQAALLGAQATLANLQNRLSLGSGAGTTRTTTKNALPPGLGFLANPAVNWYTLTPAQQRATVLASQHTTGLPTSAKAQLTALMDQRRVYTALNPGQRQALFQYTRFDSALVGAQMKSQPMVLRLFAQGLGLASPLITKYLPPLAAAGGSAVGNVLTRLSAYSKTPGFSAFMGQLVSTAGSAGRGFGTAAVNTGAGLANVFTGIAKSGLSTMMVNDIVKLSNTFLKWTGGKGFQDFLKQMKQNAPLVLDILKQLFLILGHLILALSGSTGHASLLFLDGLLKALTWLTKIPGIGSFLYNMAAFVLIFSKFGTLKAVTALWDLAYKSLGKLVGLKLGTFIGGIVGLETEGKTLGEIWKGIGGKVLSGIKVAAMAIGGWVKTVALATGRVILSGVTMVAGWLVSMGAWLAETIATALGVETTMVGVGIATGGIVLAIGLIVLGIYELFKHWKTVWGWIKRIAMDVWTGLKKGFDDAWSFIKKIFFDALKWIFDFFAVQAIAILKVAVKMFGWVPGLGGALKTALKNVVIFVDGVNKKLDELGHPHNVPINFQLQLANAKAGGKIPHNIVIPGMATGSGAGGASPGWAWVGERGPELAYFHGGETVLNSSQSKQVTRGYASGTPGVSITPTFGSINRTFAGIRRVEDSIVARAAAAITKAVEALIAALSKGGSGGFGVPGPGGGSPAANAALARRMMPSWASGSEWAAWNYVAMRESGWNQYARNPGSGAYGIPQALPPSKMGSAANPPQSNPAAQISWMIGYIRGRYGDPIGAAGHERAYNWYAGGTSSARRGWGVVGERGPELVMSSGWNSMSAVNVYAPHGAGFHRGPPGVAGAGTQKGLHQGGGKPFVINVYTNEIQPQFHAAQLGFELARRSSS